MKKHVTLLLLFIVNYCTAFATPTYQKLAEVNKCWLTQTDADLSATPTDIIANEQGWIRLHLSLVEATLRARSTSSLSAAQRSKRQQGLDALHQYMLAGNFPQNEDYTYRTPIFIDKYDNFCAVGHLIKASGHEDISRMIAASTNLAYVHDMRYPQLTAWANEYGFTVDELAWIQPSYGGGPYGWVNPIGKGTDGSVYELVTDNTNNTLYVGGKFAHVDSAISASNIACITDTSGKYTWHAMGTGVNGVVNAIAVHNGNVFVAGHFDTAGGVPVSNVAYWDGSAWHSAGCTYGTIYDLVVYRGSLYACGKFDVCAALMDVNLARWTGTMWQQIYGIPGRANTMAVLDTFLYIGGRFSYQGQPLNIIRYDSTNFLEPFSAKIENEVMDLHVFKDTLYAALKLTSPSGSMFLKFNGTNWSFGGSSTMPKVGSNPHGIFDSMSFNTVASLNDSLVIGGDFARTISPGISVAGCVDASIGYPYPNTISTLDGVVYALAYFKNKLIVGGKFKTSSGLAVNSIGIKDFKLFTSVQQIHTALSSALYPNPASSTIMVRNNFNASQLTIYDAIGKKVISHTLSRQEEQVGLNGIATGTYLAELQNAEGQKATQKLIIQ